MGFECLVHGVRVAVVSEVNSAHYDALVLVTAPGVAPPQALEDFVADARLLDAQLDSVPAVLRCPRVSGHRLVLSPTGPLTAYDDVRAVGEAARAGVQRAAAAGATRPVLVLQPHPSWPDADLVALLAALEVLYVPLQIRESFPAQAHKLAELGVYGEGLRGALDVLVREAAALEAARGVARDIGGADPERMTPLRVAAYLRETFAGSSVAVRVVEDRAVLAREYPLLAAVDRAAASVPRHRGCVVHLEYVPQAYERTVMLVGKGVTYDTGGCDIKAGGVMAGMSRDKCGAAAVAGFLKACDELRPALKVVAALGMVRNSVGEEAYVADELLRCRRGLAVRVGNTDAEGRMVMGDLLAEMCERAAAERRPQLYTVATLTGHAVRAYGLGYTALLDNHAARALGHAAAFRAAAERLGDMVEVSTLRREDLRAHRGRAPGDHVHQADNAASSALPRGHQAPAAFLLLVSGLHEADVPYAHLDVAASAGDLPHPPTAAPLLGLAAYHGLLSKR
nr:putative aminopeptidase W07G4.4 [Helicoverpa armigera]XP_049705059.1 putative aminopeptidase W07G4.4 [Helicoverpa armigera]XP_049705060.1 putative aminopeptidase W07G4.4 [Helicoverpa armigera]